MTGSQGRPRTLQRGVPERRHAENMALCKRAYEVWPRRVRDLRSQRRLDDAA